MEKRNKLTVIGGGASGLVAAIFSARKIGGKNVFLIEKNDIVGRKLLATGNGKCNLSNIKCERAEETISFFEELGVLCRITDEGLIYPCTEQASSVQEALLREAENLGINIICGGTVIPKKPMEGSKDCNGILGRETAFTVDIETKKKNFTLHSENIIVATGGKACPQYGSTGDGYKIAQNYGHTIVKPIPSLVQITSDQSFFKDLKGVRVKGTATLQKAEKINAEGNYGTYQPVNNKFIKKEKGEIQFTETGLSGICIFNLSREIRIKEEGDSFRDYTVLLDILPEFTRDQIEEHIKKIREKTGSKDPNLLLCGMVNKKLIPVLAKECRGETEHLISTIKCFKIQVSGTKGFKDAQVTSGGVNLSEINLETMESKIANGLFFVGETVDYDGICGGFNLQWAFETGRKAGEAIHV